MQWLPLKENEHEHDGNILYCNTNLFTGVNMTNWIKHRLVPCNGILIVASLKDMNKLIPLLFLWLFIMWCQFLFIRYFLQCRFDFRKGSLVLSLCKMFILLCIYSCSTYPNIGSYVRWFQYKVLKGPKPQLELIVT